MTQIKPELSRSVRRAFASAIDKLDIAQLVNGAQVAYGPYSPNSWVYDNNVEFLLPNDPAAASDMLNKDGWLLNPLEGKRYKDHKPLILTITFLDNATNRLVINDIKQQV